MTPPGGLSSTGLCLPDNVATAAECLVYAPSGATVVTAPVLAGLPKGRHLHSDTQRGRRPLPR